MADVEIDIEIDSKQARNELKKLNKDLDKTEDNAKDAGDSLEGSFTRALPAIAGAAAAIALIGKGITTTLQAAIRIEDLETQFIAFTGSAEAAAEQVERLSDFSAGTPFRLEELAEANRTLLAFGSSTDQSLEQLRQLGEVASATGKDIGELSTIFGQIQATGKLTGERFNQLIERGVNIGPTLAKSLGVAEESLEDLRRQGQISADDVAEAFRLMTSEGGIFFGATERQSKTLSGSLSTLEDNVTLLAADIGNILKPEAVGLTLAFTELAKSAREYIKDQTELTTIQRQSKNAIEKTKEEIADTEQRIKDLQDGTTTAATVFLKFGAAIGGITDPIALTESNLAKLQDRLAGLEQQATLRRAQEDFETATKSLNELRAAQAEFEAEQAQKGQAQADSDRAALAQEQAEKIAEIEKNLTKVLAQEQAVRQQLEIQENEFAIQALATKEEALAAKRIELEAQRLEQNGQFAEAAALQAEEQAKRLEQVESDKEDRISENKKKAEDDRKKILTDARKDQFNFEKITAQAEERFQEQTFAQRVSTANKGLSALSALQQSKSREAFEIGKAANIAQALVSIPTTAIEAYRSLAGIPVVGPGLGAAAAAAATAAGVSNLNRIRSTKFQEGGEVPPGFPNDSFPALLSSGEVVVPEKNFEQIQSERQTSESSQRQIDLLESILSIQEQILTSQSEGGDTPSIELSLNGEVLANAILDLNQDNARLA